MKLVTNSYGKSRVRVMKIIRDGSRHTVKELDVAVQLSGDFESSYTQADNSLVVPTDTMKNTVNALAAEHLGLETERFIGTLAAHFVAKYPQITGTRVEAEERVWTRLPGGAEGHPHAFLGAEQPRPFAAAIAGDGKLSLRSGIRDLLILKSTESGFEGFAKCEYTTLPETHDRIFATSLSATWHWSDTPADYRAANDAIVKALLEPFGHNYSASVQATLFEMGEAALEACPEIGGIDLAMPNKHCLPIDLSRFGLENRNEIFLPTDEPHGLIEATITRD
jgi:urate oxidase